MRSTGTDIIDLSTMIETVKCFIQESNQKLIVNVLNGFNYSLYWGKTDCI